MVFDVYFMSRLQYFVTNLRKKEKKLVFGSVKKHKKIVNYGCFL